MPVNPAIARMRKRSARRPAWHAGLFSPERSAGIVILACEGRLPLGLLPESRAHATRMPAWRQSVHLSELTKWTKVSE